MKSQPIIVGRKIRARTASIPGRKVQNNSFRGDVRDNVGPAHYNVNVNMTYKSNNNATIFGKSSGKRTIFEAVNDPSNTYPDPLIPGPGEYDSGYSARENFNGIYIYSIYSCWQFLIYVKSA